MFVICWQCNDTDINSTYSQGLVAAAAQNIDSRTAVLAFSVEEALVYSYGPCAERLVSEAALMLHTVFEGLEVVRLRDQDMLSVVAFVSSFWVR